MTSIWQCSKEFSGLRCQTYLEPFWITQPSIKHTSNRSSVELFCAAVHAKNKFTDTLQWSLHSSAQRVANMHHAVKIDWWEINAIVNKSLQFTRFSVCWCPSHLGGDLINALNLWACQTRVFTNQSLKTRENQASVKHRHGPKQMLIWESFRTNEDFICFTRGGYCRDSANRLSSLFFYMAWSVLQFQFLNSL